MERVDEPDTRVFELYQHFVLARLTDWDVIPEGDVPVRPRVGDPGGFLGSRDTSHVL